jgi:hypothetical protein
MPGFFPIILRFHSSIKPVRMQPWSSMLEMIPPLVGPFCFSGNDDTALSLERHGSHGDGTAMHFRFRSESNGSSGKNGALNNASGSKGGGSSESPNNVLRIGPVN